MWGENIIYDYCFVNYIGEIKLLKHFISLLNVHSLVSFTIMYHDKLKVSLYYDRR